MSIKATEQELAYGRLLTEQTTDMAQWQAAHRILPDNARAALFIAAVRHGWVCVIDLIILATETPAQTATRLGGLVGYDEREKTAVFSREEDADIFSKRYPLYSKTAVPTIALLSKNYPTGLTIPASE